MRNSQRPYHRAPLAAIAALLALSTACNSDKSTGPSVATGIGLDASDNALVGTVGQALAAPVSVHVTDENGKLMSGAVVTWTVSSSGGTVDSTTSTTDSNGDATVDWTLGTLAGTDSLTASIANGSSVVITATADAAAFTSLTLVSGDAQTVTAGSTSQPLVVKAVDQFGNPVADAVITWSVSGGGTLSSPSTTTDDTGTSQITLTTDAAPATYTVTATGPSGNPVTFTVNGA